MTNLKKKNAQKLSAALFIVVMCMFASSLKAQDAEEPIDPALEKEAPPPVNAAVYNFDADLIIGEKKKPDLLFQTGAATLGFDALLLNRSDFNDFLQFDQKRIPDLVEKNRK